MGLGNVNGSDMKSKINEIVQAGDTTSRKGRIDILKKISDLGKGLLGELNSKDETLVEIEGTYDDILAEIDELYDEMKAGEKEINNLSMDIKDIDKKLLEYQTRIDAGEELDGDELSEYRALFNQKNNLSYEVNYGTKNQKKLSKGQKDFSNKLGQYDAILSDIQETMGGYAEAGDAVRQASHDYGRPNMANNLENKSAGGNALKRNESAWISFASMFGMKNDTEEFIDSKGWTGMGDGADGVDMTYHDNTNGGYHAQYDVNKYGIGGELRDLTAKTWSYGKTVTTASNDMEKRADALDKKHKPEEEPPSGDAK